MVEHVVVSIASRCAFENSFGYRNCPGLDCTPCEATIGWVNKGEHEFDDASSCTVDASATLVVCRIMGAAGSVAGIASGVVAVASAVVALL